MGRISNYLILLVALFFMGATANGQDSNYVRTCIATLAGDDCWGRGGCHDGEQKAADFICEQLRQTGAQPLTSDGFQHYEFQSHKMEGSVEMSIDGKRLSPFWDYRISPYSTSTSIKDAPVVVMDASLFFDPRKLLKFYDRYASLIRSGFVYVDAVQWKDKKLEADDVRKLIRAFDFDGSLGCKGFLIGVDELPVWGLSFCDQNSDHAVIYVKRSLFKKKVNGVSVDFRNEAFTNKTQNVCYKIEGSQYPDSLIVFTAHYDHLGCMGDSVIFHGAHDNASGTSAVMDFARHFSQNKPAYTVVFLLFSGEESGLRGSRYFVENSLIDFDKVKLVLNLDMFCGGDEGFTVVNSDGENTKWFYDNLLRINDEQHLVSQVKPRSNAANSDHYFFSQKCPAIFIYTMGGRYGGYHHFTDTCDRCGLENYNRIFSLILQALELQ